MGLKSETRSFGDDLKVSTTQLPPMRAMPLVTQVGRLVGSALASGATEIAGKKLAEIDFSKLGAVFAGVCAQLEGDELSKLTRALLSNTSAELEIDGKLRRVELRNDDVINSVFAGRFFTLFEVLAFAIEVNFGDFFGGTASSPPSDGAAQ